MDERFLKEEGAEIFTGNELILKGALEAGCALVTGYPGSPVSDIFDAAYSNRELLKKRGILAEMANNEALAVARLNGSRMAGVRAMAVMKSVGLHVASDGLALGNLSEPHNAGGSLVVVGDDPWIESTQINNDSRYLSQHLHMPVIEPATFQEIKDWVEIAFDLSSQSNLYLTYLVTTHQADGGGTVWVRPNRTPKVSMNNPVDINTAAIDLDTNVLLPPRTWDREATLPERFRRLLEEARERALNKILYAGKERQPIGFVASGMAYCYLEHALLELGLSGCFPILKLGITYPLDAGIVQEFAEKVESIFVIEEKRGFIEQQIISLLHIARQSGAMPSTPAVWGKTFPQGLAGIPETRGLSAPVVMERLLPLFLSGAIPLSDDQERRLREEDLILKATAEPVTLPTRTPTFCPGCPHRDSSSVFLQIKKDFADPVYMKRTHSRGSLDLLFHGETGCFTMLMFEPNKPLMHNYSGMGLGGGTGAGADPFITNKQVVFLGDSTFFHSGMIAVSDSIKAGQDITYVILDNKTTAMTGHQPTPGTEMNLMGEKTLTQSIEAIVSAMAGTAIPVHRVNPDYRDRYRDLLEETILQDGVKIVIADKECGLTYQRRVRKEKKRLFRQEGYLPEERHINVTPEVCEFCLECTNVTGCPGLTIEETLYGPKIVTDQTHCVSDGACAKIKACPSFEEVIVTRRASGKQRAASREPPPIPAPLAARDSPDPWCCYTAGVGGQGAGIVSAVLALAAHLDGYRVLFSDKKGLAIRNGGVYGHLLISRSGGVLSPLVSYGKADLILGIDLLEAARAVDPQTYARVLHPEKTAAVINTALSPTVLMLMGKNKPEALTYEKVLRTHVRPEGYWGEDLSSLSEELFGSKLYANMMLLGAAYQRGHLPFTEKNLREAVMRSVAAEDRELNWQAFEAGRRLVHQPETFNRARKVQTFTGLFEEKVRILTETHGARTARAYHVLVSEAVLELHMDDDAHRDVALRVYDLIHYEGLNLARHYVDLILSVRRKDRREWSLSATKIVIHQAFKVMAIKDEVYVAHLLTSPEKRARDRARYKIDESNGDRMQYRHLNRPEFTVFGRNFQWDMVTRDWQLQIMKRLKFLRRLLPSWHKAEKEFRDWYLALVARFDADHEDGYRVWVEILTSPEDVRGYREIRKPKMEEARRKVEHLFKTLRKSVPSRRPRRRSDPTPA